MRYTKATWESSAAAPTMLYWAACEGVGTRHLVAAALACVRLAIRGGGGMTYAGTPITYERVEHAAAAAEMWVRGAATHVDVMVAYEDVSVATHAGLPDAVALEAIAYVLRTTQDPADASRAVASAVRVVRGHVAQATVLGAAVSHFDALVGAAQAEALRRMADLVRAHVPWATYGAVRVRHRP